MTPPTRYRDAGVDIDAGEETVRRIRRTVASTFGPHVVTDIGSFAGISAIPGVDAERLLVASMDGVGTKLKIAVSLKRFDTVGQDLVNHCVGDIAVHGAEPLFFLDYVGMGKLDPGVVADVVEGLAKACRENGCALIGGETAEMPGVYAPEDFDLVGTIVGTLNRTDYVDGSGLVPGDVLLGFPSVGLHTNGFSLARRIIADAGLSLDHGVEGTERSLGDLLLEVHKSYLSVLKGLRGIMKGAAHITGGGLPGNVSRILPQETAAVIDRSTWTVPPIFGFLARQGDVPDDEAYRAFNMGLGLVAGVEKDRVEEALAAAGGEGRVVGEVRSGAGGVELVGDIRW